MNAVKKFIPASALALFLVSSAWSAEMMAAKPGTEAETKEALPKGATIVGLEAQPDTIKLTGKYDYTQILINAKLSTGEAVDVTRLSDFKLSSKVAEVSTNGHVAPLKNGKTRLTITVAGQTLKVPVEVAGIIANQPVDFIKDVNPTLSKLGCNAGTCHGSKEGKNGFKLSLRGYDPIYDVRALTDDLAGRRINLASPDDSLMLLKATAGVPHEGGQRTKVGDKYYEILRAWIADGAKLNLNSPRVAKIEVSPKDPVVQEIGSRQQVRIIATYADGKTRDVTAEAFIESGNGDVAASDGGGIIRTLRRGEAPILARYEGAYAATTVTVMGDRTGFAWQDQPAYNKIDELVAAKWKRMKILPSGLCSDEDFIRRIYLDLTGLPPAAEEVTKFLADKRDGPVKRSELTDKLIGSPDYVDHWSNKWADLLQVNRKFLGEEGASIFRDWIHKQVEANTPYNQFVKEILTASGSNREHPAASYFKVLRTPDETMENTTHLFLATRFNCNKCHDHPFERWTQDQYYHMAAFFAQVDFKRDPESGERNIGGTAVEGAKPLYEIIYDKNSGEENHLRTGKVSPPDFPFKAKFDLKDAKPTRREELAEWMTSADNRYFALSYVNRIWGYLMGVGVIEPLDDIRAGNPPSNPELLDYLTKEFISHNFDVRYLIQLICKSRTYQLTIATQKWNQDDKINYSHATARRLPAEVLYDAVLKVTGVSAKFPGMKAGMRAQQLPDSGVDLPSGFLANLGRPARESACECERSNDIRLGSVMALLSGPAVSDAIADPNNEIAKLVANDQDNRKLVNDIFLRVLNRQPSEKEITSTLAAWSSIDGEHQKLVVDLAALEKKMAPIMAQQEKEREEAIVKAKADVAARETEIAPKVAEDEKKRVDTIAANTKAVEDYLKSLPEKEIAWEKGLSSNRLSTAWTLLDIKDVKASGGVMLTKQKDNSWLASGPLGISDYTITAESHLPEITGLMLEVLPDESLPNFGPGRATDGNMVLTEIKLATGSKGKGAKKMSVDLADARADFSQKDFEVKTAIDNKKTGNRNGWALAGQLGRPHHATFALAKPITGTNGTALTITLLHKFKESFQTGRFRVWVTSSKQPLDFGLPDNILPVVKTAAKDRTPEQNEVLQSYYRTADEGLLKKEQTLFTSKKPLPIDPKLIELRETLAKVSLPVPLDPKLVQLRQDVQMSTRQNSDHRLTGAQDLTWALINNPAFLFNR